MKNGAAANILKSISSNRLSNALGSSLIEAVFATVIISIVGLGVLEVALFSGAATRRAIVLESVEDRLKEVRQVLYSDEGCLTTLQPNVPAGGIAVGTTFTISAIEASDKNSATLKRTVASLNEFIGEDWSKVQGSIGYKLSEIRVSTVSKLPDNNFLMNLAFTFDLDSTPNPRKVVRNVPLQVNVAPATGAIVKCFSTDEGRASCLSQGYSWNSTLKVCIVPPVTALGVRCPAGQTLVGVSAAGVANCTQSCAPPVVNPPPPGVCSPLGATLLHGGTCCSNCSLRLPDGSLICSKSSDCVVAQPPTPTPTTVTCRPLGDMLETGCNAGGYAPDNNQVNTTCCSGMALWHAYVDTDCGTGYGYELSCISAPTPTPTTAPTATPAPTVAPSPTPIACVGAGTACWDGVSGASIATCCAGNYCQAGFVGASDTCVPEPACTSGGPLPGPAQYGYACCAGSNWIAPFTAGCGANVSGCCD